MRQLAEHGEIQRGRIGVMIQDLTPDLAEALDLDVEHGAIVSRVESGSPAEEAGLKAGDVIVAVNGAKTEGSTRPQKLHRMVRVGEVAEVEVQREQRRLRLSVRVGGAGAETGTRLGAVETPPALQGATLRDLRQGDPAHGHIEGVIAAEVEPGSPAARNGIRPGDVIVAVNRRRVRNAEELEAAFEQAGSVLALNIVRGNGSCSSSSVNAGAGPERSGRGGSRSDTSPAPPGPMSAVPNANTRVSKRHFTMRIRTQSESVFSRSSGTPPSSSSGGRHR